MATDSSLATGAGTVAIVASGEDAHLADALAASGLAGVSAPAPIVLTQTDTYTADAKNALATLKGKGVTTVKVVGGTLAVSDAVLNAIKADGFTVSRVADVDRFGTASAVATAAKAIKPVGTTGGLATAIIANGFTYVDALASGAMAYSQNFPVLLVNSDSVPAATSSAISSLGIKKVIIAGGTAAVSSAVQSSLESATGNPALRLAGTNRNGTAAAIGDYEIGTLAYPGTTAVLANGLTLVDALAMGPYAGQNKAPIVLTASLPSETQAWLDAHSNTIAKLVAAGGTSAISDADVAAAQTAAQNTSNDTVNTAAPQLQSVSFLNANLTNGGPSGIGFLSLKYTFSSAIKTGSATVNASSFKMYTAFGEAVTGSSAQLDGTDPNSADVVFDLTNGLTMGDATIAAVASGAVTGTNSKVNPEGWVNGIQATINVPAGQTRNPDLTGVSIVTGTTTAETQYRFVFDLAPDTVNATSFVIVDQNGDRRVSTAAVVDPADTTGKTILATFAAPTTGTTAARGFALPGAVSKSTVLSNPGEQAVVSNSGLSAAPDLVSVTLDKTNNQATFTFDENIETLGLTTGTLGNNNTTFVNSGIRTGFHLYYRGIRGLNTDVTSTSADVSSTDARSVVVTFPAGSVNDYVMGAYNDNGAVVRDTATNSATTGFVGAHEGQVGFAQTWSAGQYFGPKLTGVTRSNQTDGFNTTGYLIQYTFDQVVSLNSATSFFVTTADGTRQNLSSCARDAAPNANRITCTVSSTTSAEALAAAGAKLASVAADAVRKTPTWATGSGTFNIGNHEEAKAL